MSILKITDNISQAESSAIQREISSNNRWTHDREEYVSPNGESTLVFRLKSEIAFGPSLFRVSLESRGGKKTEVSSSAGTHFFLSPGRYGQGYDHWDGDPWSPDSSHIAIFDFRKHGSGGFGGGNIFNVNSWKWNRFAEGTDMVSHHMWSPSGGWYLFRNLDKWWIMNVPSGETRVLADVKRYPRHAYFLSEQRVLIIEKSFKLLSLGTLDVLAEESHAALEGSAGDTYSFYDAKGNRVLFGVGTSIRDVVMCEKWYAIEAV